MYKPRINEIVRGPVLTGTCTKNKALYLGLLILKSMVCIKPIFGSKELGVVTEKVTIPICDGDAPSPTCC